VTPASHVDRQPELIDSLQRHFIEVEKNLIAIGFFTPSSCRIMTDKRKITRTVRYLDGKRLEATATIFPSAYYGLPVTADQDKYFALLKIIQDIRRCTGAVPNPVGFTSAGLLKILGLKKNGKNYADVAEWLKRMTATTINATIYFAGKKVWVEDTFHVFDRAVTKGMDLGDGAIADMNYIWLSAWQLDNLIASYQLPIDFDAYCRLRNHISKALVPLLQIWLYSSIGKGKFEKSYSDLCQLLNIRRYEHLSKIKEVLAPSLDELVEAGYISEWLIEPRASADDFKICLAHGPKFFEDRELRGGRPRPLDAQPDNALLPELVARGVLETVARQMLARIPDDQPVADQLEWADFLLNSAPPGKFRNPAGFYVYVIRNAVLPPAEFETSRLRRLRKQAETEKDSARLRQLEEENEYAQYCRARVAEALRSAYPPDRLNEKLSRIKLEIRRETPAAGNWLPVRLEELALQRLEAEVARDLPGLAFEDFIASRSPQLGLFPSTPE